MATSEVDIDTEFERLRAALVEPGSEMLRQMAAGAVQKDNVGLQAFLVMVLVGLGNRHKHLDVITIASAFLTALERPGVGFGDAAWVAAEVANAGANSAMQLERFADALQFANVHVSTAGSQPSQTLTKAYNNRAMAHLELGNLLGCERDLDRADEVSGKLSEPLQPLLQMLSNNRQALELARSGKAPRNFDFGEPPPTGHESSCGRPDDERLEKAIADAHRSANGSPKALGIFLGNIATRELEAGRYEAARSVFLQAKAVFDAAPGCNEPSSNVLYQLGLLERRVGSRDEGTAYFKSAWDKIRGVAPRSRLALMILCALAEARTAERDWDRAAGIVARGMEIYEEMRPQAADDELDYSEIVRAYRTLVSFGMLTAIKQNRHHAVLGLSERAKARFWLESLGNFDTTKPGFVEHSRELFSIVGADTLVLSYFLDEYGGLVYSSMNGWAGCQRITIDAAELLERVLAFRRALTSSSRRPTWRQLSRELSRILLPSGAESPIAPRSIVIMPDESLWLLPFELLEAPLWLSSGTNMQLGEALPISYLPSATVMEALRERARPETDWARRLLLLYDPEVPNAAEERATLEAVCKDKVQIVEPPAEATTASICELAKTCAFMHVTSHAISTHADAHISLPGGRTVSLNEIARTPISSRLVFLSACGTSFGTASTGEGVMSLSRGFILSGCRCVVGTAWPIQGRGLPRLVESFYGSVFSGHSFVQAFYRARLDQRDAGAPIGEWGAFQMLGNGDSTEDKWQRTFARARRITDALDNPRGENDRKEES